MHPCNPAILHQCYSIIDYEFSKQKCLYPLHFLHFFFHCWISMEIFTVLFQHDLSGGKCASLWACLLFEYPPFSCLVLYYGVGWTQPSLVPLWFGSRLCLMGCKLRAAARLFCSCWKTFPVFFCPPRGAFCSLLQFCSTKFLRHGQCPRTLWSGWASGTALAGEFACTSGCSPFCCPSPGQFCSCSFVLPWKDYPKSFFGK